MFESSKTIIASSPEDLARQLNEPGNEDLSKIIGLLVKHKDKLSKLPTEVTIQL